MNAPEPLNRAATEQYAAWFRALADPTRVRIMSLLAGSDTPMTVREIVAGSQVTQSTVSQHLKVLAAIGFIGGERRGTASLYRINPACISAFPTAADILMRRPAPTSPPTAQDTTARGTRARVGAVGVAAVGVAAERAAPAIREMTPADADEVLTIYQAGLDAGNASFETRAPSWEAFDAAKLPAHRHVAVDRPTGSMLGWVAVSPVSARPVYAGVVEHSVYVSAQARGRGVGQALLLALIASAQAAGIWTIQSGIFPENTASLRLHERAGFRVVGMRERIGRHHGRWRDVVLVERRTAA
ncbi:MAG TPA: metalloregulator ArsR/SmtB family transcription factor [Streptosporangiaceae bacterium]|jgi:phosphinothricin acetyltransferase|nr:metalloregulator ArsR/SmtB family transcription factor [Streptosporangiaceae bacterium]